MLGGVGLGWFEGDLVAEFFESVQGPFAGGVGGQSPKRGRSRIDVGLVSGQDP